MNRMKKWAKMIFAMLLAVSLVFTSNSAAAFAFTVKNGAETLTEADGVIWQHYEFDGEQEGAPKKVFDCFDGSKAENELSVVLTNEDIHNSGEEGLNGWYPTEDKNYVFVNNMSVRADLSDGIGVGFFRDNTVKIIDTSESGIEINGDGCAPELLPKDANNPANGIGDEIIANVDLLENMRTTAENPYDSFWKTDELPVVVEVVLNGYDRPENSDFPISIASASVGSVSDENVIDGWDKMKARVTEGSVTLSWSAESKPVCIRIEGGDDAPTETTKFDKDGWEIRDIEDGVTSVSINVGKKDFYCIEAIYENENPFDSFGPTEDFPVLIEVALVDYARSENSDLPLSIELDSGEPVSGENVIDGWDMMKARVAAGSVVLKWSAESKPTQICIEGGDDDYSSGKWEIRDIEDETSTLIKVGKDNRERYYIEVKYGNYGPGPEDDHIIGVDFLPDLSSLPEDDDAILSLDIEVYRGEKSFGLEGGRYEFGKSNCDEHLIELTVPDDATDLGFRLQTAGKKVVSAAYIIRVDDEEINRNAEEISLSDDEINEITSGDGCIKIPVVESENWISVVEFKVVIENDNQGGGQGGSNDITYSEDTTLSENTTKTDVNVKGAKLTIDTNCSLRIEHELNIGKNAAIVGTSDTSKLVFAHGAFSKGIDLYCNEGKISGGLDNSFENQGEGPAEFIWDASSNRWVTDSNPNAGDAPWYTVSYGNSANLSIKNGQVYAERVHVGDITYTVFEDEYNASDSDQIYSMMDTIFHKKTKEEENDPNYKDTLEVYGIGGSDGDIFFRKDIYGASIDFKFIPDFGYQLKNIYTNENEQDSLMNDFNAQEAISSFRFEVKPNANVHFEVKFVEANNTVIGNAGLSSTARIESSNAAGSGTLEMKIDSGTQSANIPKDSEVLAAYDITLKNVVSKGEGRGNWETAMTDLGSNNATITLPVSDTTNYTYTVIRNHNGEETTLDTKVTEDGISFETNQFSTYTIVKKPVATKEPTPTVTPTVIPTVEPTAEPTPAPHVCKGEAVAEVPATCTESGTKAYYKCECGKFYEDEACTKEIEDLAAWLADENGGKIVAKGHTVVVDKAVAATSTKSGLTEGSHCSVCNEVLTAQVKTTYTKVGNVYTTSKTTVTYAAPAKTTAKTIEVPATVKVNGKTYKVTSIEAGAFKNCKKFTTVKIGSNVKTIGDEAFKGCKNLKTITIGSNVTAIGANAFAGCTKLKTVKLNSKIKTIDENAFSKCTSLTEIVIPDKVTEIADNAFNGCTKLKKVTIGKAVKTIGEKAFNGCKNLTSIKILSTKLTKISTDAFKGISSKAKFTVPSKKVASYTKLIKASGAPSKVSVTKN